MSSQILSGQRTLDHLMRQAGYHTAFLGKVHLGGTVYSKSTGKPKRNFRDGFRDFDFSREIEDSPASLGFNYAYELPQGIQGSPYLAFENGKLVGKESELEGMESGNLWKPRSKPTASARQTGIPPRPVPCSRKRL